MINFEKNLGNFTEINLDSKNVKFIGKGNLGQVY